MDLGTAVNQMGRLIGVLTGDARDVSLDRDWFRDPVGALEGVPARLDALAGVIAAVLGPGADSPPPVFPGACWYAVPNPITSSPTVFHVVAGPAGDPAGQIGAGVLHQAESGGATVTAYGYVPLFAHDPSGATPLLESDPCRLGLRVAASTPFQVDAASFTALRLDARIPFSGAAPTFTLAFEGLTGTSAPAAYTTLDALLDPAVAEWLAAVLVAAEGWLDIYVSGYVTVGRILAAAGFLGAATATDPDTEITTTTYALALPGLRGKSAGEIARGLVFQALDALAAVDFPLVLLPGGGVSVTHDPAARTYGVRVRAIVPLDRPTPAGAADGGASTAPPGLDVALALGTWMTGESDDASWATRAGAPPAEAGITLTLVQGDAASCRFAPALSLGSVGVNLAGAGGAPLLSVQGVSLAGAELRALYDPARGGCGFAARLEEVGFPLAPPFPGGTGGNPVARNLLAGGGDPAQAGQASATSPAFSAQAAYVRGHGAAFHLLGPDGSTGGTAWFPVQRRFGPVSCRRIGVGVGAPPGAALDLVLDGGVELGGLSLQLDQLTVGVPLSDPADPAGYTLDLQGLELAFTGPGVQVGAGLLKLPAPGGGVEYDGEALLQAGGLAIDALGSYAALEGGGASLFVFAWLNRALGGPACFYVTGLAAGFGYNRSLRLPARGQVQDFPLVAGLSTPALLGGDTPSPASALAALAGWVPPTRGEYWLAAGVQLTSFGVVSTRALVAVEAGQELTVAVLGVSTLRQPQSGESWVYAELGVEAVAHPDGGELHASAVLAPGSYVITPDAHLTGGFAFAAWWEPSAHAGDFVLTLGGYHPAFVVPDHYPRVPRLGINWRFDASTSLVGGGYFALTPVAMMAGADLQLTYALGNFRAWLRARCDAIVFWKPFYLVVSASVAIGASYRLHFLFVDVTLSVELGARFELWGPPVGFRVHVDWYVVSFTLGSGAPAPPTAISWGDFKGMLPAGTAAPGGEAPAAPAYLTVNANAGLARRQAVDGLTFWLVRPGDFSFTVASAVPATRVVVRSGGETPDRSFTGTPVALRNVEGGIPSSAYRSTQTVLLLRLAPGSVDDVRACMAATSPCAVAPAGCAAVPEDLAGWGVDAVARALPRAMWGEPVPPGRDPDVNGAATVSGTVGVRMAPLAPAVSACTPQLLLARAFADRTVNPERQYTLPLSPLQAACPLPPAAGDSFARIAAVDDPATAARRASLFAALTLLGASGWTNDPLPRMARAPGMDFADEPLEGSPACTP